MGISIKILPVLIISVIQSSVVFAQDGKDKNVREIHEREFKTLEIKGRETPERNGNDHAKNGNGDGRNPAMSRPVPTTAVPVVYTVIPGENFVSPVSSNALVSLSQRMPGLQNYKAFAPEAPSLSPDDLGVDSYPKNLTVVQKQVIYDAASQAILDIDREKPNYMNAGNKEVGRLLNRERQYWNRIQENVYRPREAAGLPDIDKL